VLDTFTGVNFRFQDNVLQALFAFASVMIGAAAGAILTVLNPRWNLPWFGGALFGSFLGMVVGVFASGIFFDDLSNSATSSGQARLTLPSLIFSGSTKQAAVTPARR